MISASMRKTSASIVAPRTYAPELARDRALRDLERLRDLTAQRQLEQGSEAEVREIFRTLSDEIDRLLPGS